LPRPAIPATRVIRGGLPALWPHQPGPKSNYRRTPAVVNQVLRHRFLDPDASAEVIAQKLRQSHLPVGVALPHQKKPPELDFRPSVALVFQADLISYRL